MAYETNTITTASQIAALLTAFAEGLGFSVDDSTPASPVITIPGDEEDSNSTDITVQWLISNSTISSVSAQNYQLRFLSDSTKQAFCRGPIIDAVALTPTKVEFVGQLSPIPYIAIIISFGSNLYRHLYIGRLEKIGSYGGGEVIAAHTGIEAVSAGVIAYGATANHQYLFSGASTNIRAANDSGHVRIKHASAPAEYMPFKASAESITSTIGNGKIIGGFLDSINDGYLARGRAPFAGRTVLVPCNLYQTKVDGGAGRLIPIGKPAGFRMINLRDLVTPAELVIGSDTWHVFPAASRRTDTSAPVGVSNWRAYETSYFVGYAYKE